MTFLIFSFCAQKYLYILVPMGCGKGDETVNNPL